jgi:hypothetical protein
MAKTTTTPDVPPDFLTEYQELITQQTSPATPGRILKSRSGQRVRLASGQKTLRNPLFVAAYREDLRKRKAQWDAYVVEQIKKWGPSIAVKNAHYQQWLDAHKLTHPQGPADRNRIPSPRGNRATIADNQARTGKPEEDEAYTERHAQKTKPPPKFKPLFPDWFMNLVTNMPRPGRPFSEKEPKTYEPRRNPAGTKIEQSAMEAAMWLSIHFPRDAQAVGLNNFQAARYQEILHRDFNPRYWQQATALPRLVELYEPSAVLDPEQDIPGWYNSTRQRSKPTYTKANSIYPEPPAGTHYPQPSPGYRGSTTSNVFYDNWLAVLLEDFQLPRTYQWNDRVPVFADVTAQWRVMTNRRPTQIQFSTYHRPVFQNVDDPRINDEKAITTHGRFYNHTHPLPAGGATNYDQTLTRPFLLDCNMSAAFYSAGTGEVSRMRLKSSVAAARGRYFGDSSLVAVDFDAVSTVWMARHRDPDTGAAPALVRFNPNQNPVGGFNQPCGPGLAQWYVYKFNDAGSVDEPYLASFKRLRLASDATGRVINLPGYGGPILDSSPVISNTDDRIFLTYTECLENVPLVLDPVHGNHYELFCGYCWLGRDNKYHQLPGKITDEEWQDRYIEEPDPRPDE